MARRGRPLHPATQRIDEAIELVEKYGLDVTPATIRQNLKLGYADLSADEAIGEAINFRIYRRLKSLGLIIASRETRGRKDFWNSTPEELEAQLAIKEDSSEKDLNRIAAERMSIEFLKEQRDTFGYEVYPGLFHAEVDRIYAMHGLTSPGA